MIVISGEFARKGFVRERWMARVEDLIELERRPSTPAEILATFAESETPPSCTPSPAGGGRGAGGGMLAPMSMIESHDTVASHEAVRVWKRDSSPLAGVGSAVARAGPAAETAAVTSGGDKDMVSEAQTRATIEDTSRQTRSEAEAASSMTRAAPGANGDAAGSKSAPGQEVALTWANLIFGIGPERRATGKPKSRLIYPLSPFGIGWVSLTAIFLAYTAIATPAMISLHWLDPQCSTIPTLPFDAALDCFFILDICLNFGTGVYAGGVYYDRRRAVALMYLKGSFLFDLVTSFPVSFFELSAAAVCARAQVSDIYGTIHVYTLELELDTRIYMYVCICVFIVCIYRGRSPGWMGHSCG